MLNNLLKNKSVRYQKVLSIKFIMFVRIQFYQLISEQKESFYIFKLNFIPFKFFFFLLKKIKLFKLNFLA